MKFFIPIILVAVACSTSAWSEIASSYSNIKYGYSIQYPANLLKLLPEPDAGDGVTMEAKVGQAEIRVWGEYGVQPYSPEDIAQMAERECPNHKASYRVTKPNLVAVSCAPLSTIFYQKTLIRGDRLATLWAKYPLSEKARWDAVVARMAKSLAIN